jgi:hypothetical protein
MTIVNDACTIVQASFTIVTYDRENIFIIQATESHLCGAPHDASV